MILCLRPLYVSGGVHSSILLVIGIEFASWKNMVEEEEECSFIKSTGDKKNDKGLTVTYFQCNRGGSYRKAKKKND